MDGILLCCCYAAGKRLELGQGKQGHNTRYVNGHGLQTAEQKPRRHAFAAEAPATDDMAAGRFTLCPGGTQSST